MTAAVSTSVLPASNLTAAPCAPAQGRGAAFAQMLDARRAEAGHEAEHAEASKTEQPKTEDTSSTDNAQAARSADEARNRQLRAQRHGGTRPPAAEGDHVREPRSPAEPAQPASSEETPIKADDTTEQTVDPSLTDWLALLNLPPAQPASTGAEAMEPAELQPRLAADQAAGGLIESGPDVTAETPAAERSAPRRGVGNHGVTDATRRHGTEDLKTSRAEARTEGREGAAVPMSFQAAMEQVATPVVRANALANDMPKGDLAAVAAPAMSTAGPLTERPAAETTAPAVVHMATPADAPEFPRMLGAQLSVLAKDGVQQAELHLNPADMGPISVQIALDGDSARVDFGADSAATRQIIESGLPELAAALRDAGFTLSGGGVHSQAQQQGQREQQGGRAGVPADGRSAPSGDVVPASRAPVRTVRVGGIDLYA